MPTERYVVGTIIIALLMFASASWTGLMILKGAMRGVSAWLMFVGGIASAFLLIFNLVHLTNTTQGR